MVLSCRQLKQKKKENIFQLHDSIAKSKPLHLVKKYYVILPGEEVHHAYHETHGNTSYAQRVHPKLIEKIYELVSEETTEVQEVKRALKHYVQHVHVYLGTVHPSMTNICLLDFAGSSMVVGILSHDSI